MNQYLVTITTYEGECVETYIYEDDADQDSVFWNLRVLLDPSKDLNIQYLSSSKKKSPMLTESKKLGN